MSTWVVAGGVGSDGARLDVRVDDATGRVLDAAPSLDPGDGERRVDAHGMVVLAAPAEPHVHLDKVGTAHAAPNPTGELMDAVGAWFAYAPRLDRDDVVRRATAAVDDYVAHGTTAIRTHVNLHVAIGLDVLEAVLEVRGAVADRCTVQVVALCMPPLTGDAEAAVAQRDLARQACDLGIDVVGGPPVTDADPQGSVGFLTDLAAEQGLPIDLHVDETLDPASRSLLAFADAVERRGLGGSATASHCVSLGMRTGAEQRSTARRLAECGVSVVALPVTNLWLQGRGVSTATPRGLTAVRALLDAGVVVATGVDNIEDPFCPLGRPDSLDAARLLALAAHLTPAEAWTAATGGARAVMGLPSGGLSPGAVADLLLVEGAGLDQVLARAPAGRTVVRAGRVVASTSRGPTGGANSR